MDLSSFTDADYIKYSREHLYYEIGMFTRMLEEILNFQEPHNDEQLKSRNNSCLESFLIHTRNLMEFFYEKFKKYPEKDVRAQDFMPPGITWTITKSSDYPDITKRISREIEHITTERKMPGDLAKQWSEMNRIIEIISIAFEQFKKNCGHNKVHPDILNISLPEHIIQATQQVNNTGIFVASSIVPGSNTSGAVTPVFFVSPIVWRP